MHDETHTQRRVGDRHEPVQVALLTPVGRGALAVVGVAGPGSTTVVDAVFQSIGGRVADRPDGAICFGRWRSSGVAAAEDVVVTRLAADRCEIHCHGGLAAPRAIIASLVARGAEAVSWETWVRSGRDHDATGSAADEARIAICRAGGPRAVGILGRQIAGALDREITRIESLLAAGDERAKVAACDRLLRASRIGLRLTTPWRVGVVGPVNVGKSSLLNALAGHARSIVSPVPGTTRDIVATRLVIGGWEIELVDTAGLRPADNAGDVERAGIARALAVQGDVDLLVRATEAGQPAAVPPAVGAGSEGDADGGRRPEVIEVTTKADIVADHATLPGSAPVPGRDGVVTSVVTGLGIDRLADRIVAMLVPEDVADPDLLAGAVPFTAAQVTLVERLRAAREFSPRERPQRTGRGGES